MQNPVFKLEKVVRSKSEEEMQDFEGPLDLILYLLGKNKMEIQDISISLICDQYMAWLARRQEMDLEVASEFVTMASQLVYIKTRMLLSIEDEEAQSEMDALIASLEERKRNENYAKVKSMAARLEPMGEFGRNILTRPPEPVKPFGIDESWLDVTHTLHLFGGDAKALADHLRQRMKQEMGLTLSVGVSFNKVFAKLGSDYRKPDATTVVSRENWQRLVWPLPVGALLYVGGAARKILAQFGVKTIGELAACKRDALETLMGKMGVQLHDYANGLDTDPVRSRYEPEMVKSVGNGTTFPKNLTTAEQVRGGVAVLADSVATRLRHSGLYAGGVQVTVRDPQFHDRSRQMQLSAPTHLIRELTAAAMDLTGQLWKPPAPVRALTVTAIHLVRSEDAYEQVDLFTAGAAPKKEKQEKLEAAMDRLRGKFGTDVISYGAARPEKEEDPLP